MIHPDILTALARERSGTFQTKAEAETARGARQARRHRQPGRASGTRTTPLRRLPPWLPGRSLRPGPPRLAAEGTPVVLRDGSAVLIRPVRSTDAPLLADGFARLSPRSRWMRFLGAKTTLSTAELRYFTEVDHHAHEAIGALSADGRGVGIARYIRTPTTRRPPRSPSPSWTTGRAGDWAPSCSPGCPTGPGRPASTASPRWPPRRTSR